jgi:hypothetical protein
MRFITQGSRALAILAVLTLAACGCGGGGRSSKPAEGDGKTQAAKDKKETDTSHEGWWCDEHGIPEDECIMCNAKLKAEAKASGDWCKHNRAKSQCFACNPSLKETFDARYRAKFPGKEPPPATEND